MQQYHISGIPVVDDGKLVGGKYTLDEFERGSMDSAVAAKLERL